MRGAPPPIIFEKVTSTNYMSLEREFIGESGSFKMLVKCFDFAIL